MHQLLPLVIAERVGVPLWQRMDIATGPQSLLKSQKIEVFRWFKFTLKPPYSIAWGKLQLAIWDTSFWTFLAQILDTRDLETYPRTYSGHFWNMSIFDDSRAVWVLFRKWVVSENRILLRNGWPIPGYSDLVLGGEVPRLSHGPICFPIQNT